MPSHMLSMALKGSRNNIYFDLIAKFNLFKTCMDQESQPVEVTLGLTLQSILDVDMDKGILTSLAWLNMEWDDPSLTWWNSDLKDVRRKSDSEC